MHKTLHQKLTDKLTYANTTSGASLLGEDVMAALKHEQQLLSAAAKDLLSPRPEAISRLLEMSRSL